MPEKALTKPSAPQLVEFDRRLDGAQSIAGALSALQTVVAQMEPDDFLVELDSIVEGDKRTSHLRVRAYRSRKE